MRRRCAEERTSGAIVRVIASKLESDNYGMRSYQIPLQTDERSDDKISYFFTFQLQPEKLDDINLLVGI